MSDFLEPIGNEEAILQNILGADNELLPPMSRNEKILLDILGENYPIEPPMSRMEALLIALKEKIEHDTPSGKINITENGTDIDIAQYATADVAVPTADLGTKNITANGTYAASSDNLDGYDEVTVDVPMPEEYCIGGSLVDKTLTGYHYPLNPSTPYNTNALANIFGSCPNLERVENFPDANPGYRLFYSCTNLKYITLPEGITFFGQGAFQGCTNLIMDHLPISTEGIGNGAFINCKNVTFSYLPSGLTSLGTNVFEGCTAITISEVPVGITGLTAFLFRDCTGITEMKLLGDIVSIGQGVFQGCSNILLYDFTANTAVPTLASSNAFTDINANCKIVVPDNLYDTWIASTNWVAYASYIVRESDYVGA